jgi:pimeloyl-ACP methyl ester carboxylesterase
MPNQSAASNITAPTRFLEAGKERYAYRRFGAGRALPLLCLQHFTGTMDNWDAAVTDPLAAEREVILFESAGIGRSSGSVPNTIAGMAADALAFLDGLGIRTCDVLGFSLGGMVAQQMVLERPSIFRRMALVGTAPRGGEDIMHLEKPNLAKPLGDPSLQGYAVLQKIFFAPTDSSQAAGAAFIKRLMQRSQDREPVSGPAVAQAQMAAFSRMGASFGRTLLGPEENSPPNSRDEWRLRRDDPRLELILAERASVECHAFDVSGLRARFALPIPRVVYPAGCRVPCLRVAVRALLRAQVRITEPGKQNVRMPSACSTLY